MSALAPAVKDTNPKDALGVLKAPLSLVSPAALALLSVAQANGAMKYGRWNWRAKGVSCQVYIDACLRHLLCFFHGEEKDEDGVPHLGAALACLNIIADAQANGSLKDDRPPRMDVARVLKEAAGQVAALAEKHKDLGPVPHHYSIKDVP